MKVKLDENIPQSVGHRLAGLGVDADTVLDEKLGGRSDESVWSAAQAEERFFFVVATPTKVRVMRPESEPGDTE